MSPLDIITPEQRVGVRSVDVSRGAVDGSISSQWYSRPDDQRFITLDSLFEAVSRRKETAWVSTTPAKELRVRAQEDQNKISLILPNGQEVKPTHWSFGQMAQAIGAPAGYLRSLPSSLAGVNLQWGLANLPSEVVKFFGSTAEDGGLSEFRAMTSPGYGRVFDADVVSAIMNTVDDTWKVPGVINWGNRTYDPDAPVSKQSTTLYASDRDVFVFLCRDQYPIEVGRLDNGEPDYLFPGFFAFNSEVGARSFTLAQFYMRGLCQNRNAWGVEGKQTLRLIHSGGLPDRFMGEAVPALKAFSETAASAVRNKVLTAAGTKIASDDDEAVKFLADKAKLPQRTARAAIAAVLQEEGHPLRSLWDAVNGVTAIARNIPHQDERIGLEQVAGRLMAAV